MLCMLSALIGANSTLLVVLQIRVKENKVRFYKSKLTRLKPDPMKPIVNIHQHFRPLSLNYQKYGPGQYEPSHPRYPCTSAKHCVRQRKGSPRQKG